MPQPQIKIAPQAKRNALFITLSGIVSLLLLMLISQYFWQQAKFSLMLLILLNLSVIFLGVLKLLEPATSFKLTPKTITFIHRKGSWQLSWDDIRNINPITNTYGIDQEQLCYIGLRLNSLEVLKTQISPRLANYLIHEQKPLVTYCVSRELMAARDAVINFEPYICQDGSELKGPVAGFFHQAQALNKAIGAHLFINDSSIDRSSEAFTDLLKQCKSAATHYK